MLVLLLLVIGGAAAVVLTQVGGGRRIELREQVGGDANQALDEIRGLIRDNTR